MRKKRVCMKSRLYAKSQDELARRLGVSQSRVSQIVNGVGAGLSWSLAKRMAKLAGVEPAWVMDASVARLRTIIRKISANMVEEQRARAAK